MPLLKYESPFVKRLALPQEPRLFCLIYNGVPVEYESTSEKEEAERESIIFKEIHGFTQRSLDDRGAFLLDFNSETFVWFGKKLLDKDRVTAYQLAF